MNTVYIVLSLTLPFILTTIGASFVFFLNKKFNDKLNSVIAGFSGGIMIAASIWSMIIPSFEYTTNYGFWDFLPAILGVLIGCFFVLMTNFLLNKTQNKTRNSILKNKKLSRFLIAFTIHNIPEGLAVGFAVGCALISNNATALISAFTISVGIAVQNLPEGTAVALPVYKSTKNKSKSFLIGMLSGVVEPIFALLGMLLATKIQFLMPWLLCFSAGCMIFVTVTDLLPESNLQKGNIGTWAFIVGFLLMMLLDIVLS